MFKKKATGGEKNTTRKRSKARQNDVYVKKVCTVFYELFFIKLFIRVGMFGCRHDIVNT